VTRVLGATGSSNPMNNDEDETRMPSPPNVTTHFAWMRTRMSAARTLEAWVRTAVALIAFGFTIVQFFDGLNAMENAAPARHPALSRYMGLTLIGIGTAALSIAIWQYQKLVKYLHGDQFRSISGIEGMRRWYANLAVAVVLCLVGLVTFVSILIRTVAR
jgi:putative membrane protein